MYESIVRLDLHGKNAYQARVALDAALRRAKGGTYRKAYLVSHDPLDEFGAVLRDMIRGEYARHPRVIRLEVSADGGTTDLVLREL